MNANWVKQSITSVASAGLGTITLGSAASNAFITIGDAYPYDTVVEYMIEEGNDREYGIGTYTHSGTTLARTTITETLKSGTYDASAPTAITASSAGEVYLSAGSRAITPPPAYFDDEGAGFRVSDHLCNYSEGTQVLIADTVYYQPHYLARVMYADNLACVVNNTASATKMRMGVYNWGSDGKPDNLIVSSGDVTPATDQLNFPITATVFQPGWYWVAFVSDTASTIVDYAGESHSLMMGHGIQTINTTSTIIRASYTELSSSWTVLPASPSVTASTNRYLVYAFVPV